MATKTRDRDELEGTLLPPPPPPQQPGFIPVATIISDDSIAAASVATASAVPVDYFQYGQGNLDDDDVCGALPTSPFLPARDGSSDTKGQAQTESERFRVADAVGKALADAELDDIDRARRRIGATQYHSAEAVRVANETARRRDREGLKITEDRYFRPAELRAVVVGGGSSKREDSDATTYGNKKGGGGGYECAEYDVSEYETKEYDTSYEYKSVYD